MTNNLRVAAYVRMSDHKQENSPERQRSLIQPYCQQKGYKIIEEYVDLAQRGGDATRSEFQRLLQDATKGLFDIIVIDERSRLSRQDPIEFVYMVAYPLREARVVVEIVAEGRQVNWETDNLGELLVGFIGQHNAYQESVTLGRRTATGMANKAKDGLLFVGRPPYGYRYVYVKEPDRKPRRIGLEPDKDHPERVEVVRRIFDAYLHRDLSLLAIVAELNSLGIPSPQGRGQWCKNTVHNILTNHVYAGFYVWGRVPQGKYYRCDGVQVVPVKRGANKSVRRRPNQCKTIPGRHEPLIPPAIFDETQERLAANRKRTSPGRKRSIYPLSQLLSCSHCGSAMYGTRRKSGGQWEAVYRCGSDMTRGTCAPRVVRESTIIELVAEVLQEHLLDPSERQRLETEMRRQHEGNQVEQAIRDLQRRRDHLNGEIDQAVTNLARMKNDTAIAGVEAKIEQWEEERRGIEANLERLARQKPSTPDEFLAKVEKLVEVMRSGDHSLVRPALRESIGRVDLRFDTVPKKAVTRYPLAGGVVHFLECADLVSSGPGAGR
jgi:site-specific DNA recombinase